MAVTRARPTASGSAANESRWALPPAVLPRGYRELLWHLSLATLTIGLLLLPGGWYALLSYAGMLRIVPFNPRQLRRMASLSIGIAFVLLTATGGATSYPHHLGQLVSNNLAQEPLLLSFMTWSLLIQPLALLAVATWLSFDTRAVTRGVVDERVYQRQVHRRGQALRHAHRIRTTPTVISRP